ncbi:NACHT and WD repeat domain-containing protein [Streptomyces sp. NPDC004539]|uniref:NACHT and WD repeat domain-containing protein n=1 Tax=Streptomyces sp. NPDC004539 TaxID=3154280 RepID=UPI0033BD57DD
MTDRHDRVAVTLSAWAAGDSTVIQAGRDIVVHHYADGTTAYDARPSAVDECPYPGLKAFDRESAHWFFGRQRLLVELGATLARCVDEGTPAAVVAPSGAGKSSLLRAGLLPELTKGRILPGSRHWPQLLLRPTEDPVGQLAQACARLTDTDPDDWRTALDHGPATFRELLRTTLQLPPGHRVVIVVDQLEELFTQCRDESARTRFVDALASLTPLALLVYGLRADRYGDCTPYPHLLSALRNDVIVGAMSDAEIREAIEGPTRGVGGLSIDPQLVDVIVRDLRAGAGQRPDAYPPGRLPFLSQALHSTWQQRTDDRMTLAAYRAAGGIDNAVNSAAQRVYRNLTDDQKRVARVLFTGLVRVDERGETTFRRRTRRALLQEALDPAQVPPVVDAFTEARLLTQNGGGPDGETVEITHEALLREWKQLHKWIAPDEKQSLVRQEVWEAAARWSGGEHRDRDVLFRGKRLDDARNWSTAADPADVTRLVADFLHASGAQQRRSRRLRQGAVAVVSALALIASALAVYALDRRREAVEQRDEAIFNRVTAEADRLRGTDSALAAQLDLAAYDMRPTDTLRTRLLAASGAILPQTLPGRFGTVYTVAFGPGGDLMTAASAPTDTLGRLRLWNVPRTASATPLTGEIRAGTAVGGIQPLVHDQRNGLLVWGSSDGLIRVLDVSDPAHPQPLSAAVKVTPGTVNSLALSSDGSTLAVGVTVAGTAKPGVPSVMTGDVQLWSLADPRAPRRLSTPLSARGQGVQSVALTPDRKVLVASGGTAQGGDGAALLKLWDISDPAHPKPLPDPKGGHNVVVNQIAISPDGRTLATASSDYRVLLWNLADPGRLTPVNQLMLGSIVNSVAFSPDGQLLATGDTSGGVNLWNVRAPARARVISPTLRGHSGLVSTLAFSPDSRTVVSGGADGVVRLWRLPPALVIGDEVLALAVTPDGRRVAVATGNRVTLWDVSAPDRLVRLGELPLLGGSVNALAFRPGSRQVLATGEFTGAVRLWDVTSPTRPVALSPPLTGNGDPVSAVAFGADGTTLAVGYLEIRNRYAGGLRAWNTSDPARPTALGGNLGGITLPVRALAADPANDRIYSGDMIGLLRAWRATRGTAPVMTGYAITPQVVFAVALSRDGHLLATAGGDSRLHLWNVSGTGAPRKTGTTLTAGAMLNSADFSPDGTLLASGDAVGEIRLWSTTDPTRATLYGAPVPGHIGSVSGLRFLPRGTLLSAGGDGTVRLWQTAVPQARTLICAATRTAMTKEAWREHVSADLPYTPPCA